MLSASPTQIVQHEPQTLCSVLGLDRASFKALPGFEKSWQMRPADHINKLSAFRRLCEELSAEITLRTYLERNGLRQEISETTAPKYFAIGLDTETTGVRVGVSEQSFRNAFPQANAETYRHLFREPEFADLSRYLRLIQLAVIPPRITEHRTETAEGVRIEEKLSVEHQDPGQAFLLYVSDLDLEQQRQGTMPAVNWLDPLKLILEDPRRILFIMNANFEYSQFAPLGLQINNVIDNMHQARQLRGRLSAADFFSDDIEARLNPPVFTPGSFSMAAIAGSCFGVVISKQEQKGEWNQIPLRASQIEYAHEDPIMSLRYGLFFEEVLRSQDQQIAEQLAGYQLELLSAESQQFRDRLADLIKDIFSLYTEQAGLLKESGAFDAVMKLAAAEQFLENQLKTLIIPALFEADCRKFSSLQTVPQDYAFKYKKEEGSCQYEPQVKRSLNLKALMSLGSYVCQQLDFELTLSELKNLHSARKLNRSELNYLRESCFERKYLNTKLGLSYPEALIRNSEVAALIHNPYTAWAREKLQLNPAQIDQSAVGRHLSMMVEARTERMALLNQYDFLGNKLGLHYRKIQLYRIALKNAMQRLARQHGYISDQGNYNRDFTYTTAFGLARLHSSYKLRFIADRLLTAALQGNRAAAEVTSLLSSRISADKLSRLMDDLGFTPKIREEAIDRIFPLVPPSPDDQPRRVARVWPNYRGAYG